MAPMRQGQRLTRRSALKVVLSRELPRSAGARVAACSRFTVRWSSVSSASEVFLIGVVSAPRSPSQPRSASTAWSSLVHSASSGSASAWARSAVVSCSRPGRTPEVHSDQPSGAAMICTLPPWVACLPDHHRSTRRSGRSARAVGPGARQRSVRISVPFTVTCGWPAARAASSAPRNPGATAAATRRREAELAAHTHAECALRDHPALGRWLLQTPSGRLVLDTAKIRAEVRLDGKYLLVTCDPDLTAEDVALGYKNLLEAERGFRDLESTLELWPVYLRLEPRIRAHVLLCWLALLLIRAAERCTGKTWPALARELGRLHAVTLTGPTGSVTQTTELSTAQASILRACELTAPPRNTALHPA